VVLYIVIPVILAQLWRRALLARGPGRALTRTGAHRPVVDRRAAGHAGAAVRLPGRGHPEAAAGDRHAGGADPDPGVLQLGLAYWLNRRLGESHSVACPSALIGASNFFELAVAAAISLFGFESGAALATVVGVLIEVPVMLLVVRVVRAGRRSADLRPRRACRCPMPPDIIPRCKELRELAPGPKAWSGLAGAPRRDDRHHEGADRLDPAELGAVRPTQGKTLAVMQVSAARSRSMRSTSCACSGAGCAC
jgi:hypothetical protein